MLRLPWQTNRTQHPHRKLDRSPLTPTNPHYPASPPVYREKTVLRQGPHPSPISVAELRNEYGTDHGGSHLTHPLSSCHARLDRSVATAYCEFPLRTLEDQSPCA